MIVVELGMEAFSANPAQQEEIGHGESGGELPGEGYGGGRGRADLEAVVGHHMTYVERA